MRSRRVSMRSVAVAAGGVALAVAVLPALPASAQTLPTPTSQPFSGYSTGTVLHADALQAGLTGPQVANVEEAFSGSAVASQGLTGQIVNEMSQVVQPTLPAGGKLAGRNSFARGSGLEVGLVQNLPAGAPQIPVNKVQVSAPPATADKAEVGPVALNPLAFASVLKGAAAADFKPNTCIVGKAISQGEGYAADAQLLNTLGTNPNGSFAAPLIATDNTTSSPAVTDSTSTEYLSPVAGSSNLGLTSETSQIIAPVTLFKNTPTQLTIQVAGVWRLRAVAGGTAGSGAVTFAPTGNVSPSTPVLTVLSGPPGSQTKSLQLTLQQLLGDAGLTIPLGPLANITIGTKPHAIGNDAAGAPIAANGTSAAGAVDIAKVQLLPIAPGVHVADIRVGHFESRASVPAGGVNCPIPVTKTASATTVPAGGSFTYTISVQNPFDCTLTNVKVVDTITPTANVAFQVTSPSGTSGGTVTFPDIGPIAPGVTKRVTIGVSIPQNSGAGTLKDTVKVTATCAAGAALGGTSIFTGTATAPTIPTITLAGTTTVNGPTIGGHLPTTGSGTLGEQGGLPATGGSPIWPIGGTLLLGLAAYGLRRFRGAASIE